MAKRSRTAAGALDPNRMNRREAAVLELGARQMACVEWDFDVDGGAVGDILLGTRLPAGAIILDITSDILTAVAGADDVDIAAGSQDLKTAIDLTAASGVEPQTPASRIKLTADAELKLVINTNAASAGKLRLLVEYAVSK